MLYSPATLKVGVVVALPEASTGTGDPRSLPPSLNCTVPPAAPVETEAVNDKASPVEPVDGPTRVVVVFSSTTTGATVSACGADVEVW